MIAFRPDKQSRGLPIKTTPLHPKFGVICHDVDLCALSQSGDFAEIRTLFEAHSALLFPRQSLDDAAHLRLAERFGPVENREAMAAGRAIDFEISQVFNETKEGAVSDVESLHTLNLQANMLWYTDSTFLPIPALVNILTAKVVPSQGGETELASTRAAWAEMPPDIKAPLQNSIIWHRLSSWA